MTAIGDNRRVVVDASVIGAAFFDEPDVPRLESRLLDHLWVAPTLIDYEIGSIFLKKRALYPSLRTQLDQALEFFLRSSLERVHVEIDSVAPVAERFGLSIYDASYLWLADFLNLELLTLDKKLAGAWKKLR